MLSRPRLGRLACQSRKTCQYGKAFQNLQLSIDFARLATPAFSSAARPDRHFHNASTTRQAVHVSPSRYVRNDVSSDAPQYASMLMSAEQLFTAKSSIASSKWANRANMAKQKWDRQDHLIANQVLLVGSSLSKLQNLIISLVDEPLRDGGSGDANDAQFLASVLSALAPSTPLTLKYGPGRGQQIAPDCVTLDRHWLQHSSLRLVVLIDPTLSDATYDLVYDSQAVLFVTDDYALSQSLHRSSARHGDVSVSHQLLSRFSSKPNVHLIVNDISKQNGSDLSKALEATTGPVVAEILAPKLVSVSSADAEAAHRAFRVALSQQVNSASSTHWDAFSSQFRHSNVSAIIDTLRDLDSFDVLLAQSTAFLLKHSVDEALAMIRLSKMHLDEIDALAHATADKDEETVRKSMERVWPPTSTFSGQLSEESPKVWRPAASGSKSAVDEALQATSNGLERTFDKRLQWWKMIWKVDDVRAELESACTDFAKSLESDLAYESGRLATLQLQQNRSAEQLLEQFRRSVKQLSSINPSVTRDAALLANEADAFRASQLKAIEPSTLMEPIDRRRAQLLQVGGPIDALASKTRKLALTTSVAAVVTTAGLGSASVLGSSLAMDAASSSLALVPSTALGLGLLTFTLAGWRLQGHYNKYRARFRRDWDRLVDGLDHDLRANFEHVLRRQVTRPASFLSSRILELTRSWTVDVNRLDSDLQHSSLLSFPSLSAKPSPGQPVTPNVTHFPPPSN